MRKSVQEQIADQQARFDNLLNRIDLIKVAQTWLSLPHETNYKYINKVLWHLGNVHGGSMCQTTGRLYNEILVTTALSALFNYTTQLVPAQRIVCKNTSL